MSSRGATLVGAVALASVTATFVAALSAQDRGPSLVVTMPSKESRVVLPSPVAKRPQLVIGPDTLGSRLDARDWQPDPASGLLLRTYSASWGHRWVQEVTVPSLVGPFHDPTSSVCGYQLGISAKVLDTSGPAKPVAEALGQGLRAMSLSAKEEVSKCGLDIRMNVPIPSVTSTDLRFDFVPGALRTSIVVKLGDGSRVDASASVRLVSNGGLPVAELVGAPRYSFAGPIFDKIREEAQRSAEQAVRSNPWGITADCVREFAPDKAAEYEWARNNPKTRDFVRGLILGVTFGVYDIDPERKVLDAAVPAARRKALEEANTKIDQRVSDGVRDGYRKALAALAHPLTIRDHRRNPGRSGAVARRGRRVGWQRRSERSESARRRARRTRRRRARR